MSNNIDEKKTGIRWPDESSELPGAGLAGLAHDLNSWLTPVKTCLQLWTAGEEQKALELRPTALENLTTVLNCLEALRQRSTCGAEGMKPVKLRLVLEKVMVDCQALCREKNTDLNVSCGNEMEIMGDEWLLRRLLLNLATNALHATPLGRKVEVEVKEISSPGPMVQVCFSNTCRTEIVAGGEEALRRRLGLRISHEIVRLHQGEMDIQCLEAEEKVVVVVRLPKVTQPT